MCIRRLVLAGQTLAYSVLCALTLLALAPLAAADEPEPGQTTAPPPAFEETTEPGQAATRRPGLEEIIVTARKVQEPLQQTPVSVTTFGAQDVERASMQLMQDIAYQTPALRWEPVPTQGNTPTISLRGLSQNDSLVTLEGAVGVYFDGIFMGKLQGGQANLLDVERVEVLKGPQGTLYGKNTLGGAMNLISVKPDGTFGGWGRATLANEGRTDFDGAIQFPIVGETLSARIAFQSAHRDGFHNFKATPGLGAPSAQGRVTLDVGNHGKADENRGLYGRTTVVWTPSDTFEMTVLGYRIYQRKAAQAPSTLARLDRTNVSAFAPLMNPTTGVFCTSPAMAAALACDDRVSSPDLSLETFLEGNDKRKSHSGTPDRDNLDVFGFGVTIDWDLSERLLLRSVTGHREVDGRRRSDMDGTPYNIFVSPSNHKSRQFSEELQLVGSGFLDERLDFVVGTFFFDEEADDDGATWLLELGVNEVLFPQPIRDFLGLPPGTIVPSPTIVPNSLDAKTRSWSFFGQATYSLSERLRTTLGLRLTDEKRWMKNLSGFDEEERFDDWSYTVGLDYQVNDDLMVYGKVSRGIRSGGYDGRAGNPPAAQPFDTEKLTTYEVGVKSEWFDNTLRANLAVFVSNFKDIQVTNLVSCAVEFGGVCTVRENAGRAIIQGLEFEVVSQPVAGLTLAGGLEVNDFDFRSGPLYRALPSPSPEVPPPGTHLQPQNQPRLSFNLSATYTFPMTPLGELEATADWFHSNQVEGSPNNAKYLEQGTYGLLNGRITLFDQERNLEYALFVRNALDRDYHYSGVDFMSSQIGIGVRSWNAPRTYGLQVTYRFGSDAY